MPIDRSHYPGIPEDFPIEAATFSLAGTQPKLNLVEENGKFYQVGTSPTQVQEAFDMCNDLVVQMTPYCQRKKMELATTCRNISQ